MSQYNIIERKIAYTLSKFPFLKSKIKKTYQQINYLRYKKPYTVKTTLPLQKIADQKESFFGYYDKSPINKTNEYIIFHAANIDTKKLPDPNIAVDIMLYDIKNNIYKKIDQSFTYNWQQGARLMWVDKYKFIYNNFENGNYIATCYDIQDQSYTKINFPIYDTYKDEFALSLNFERLQIARGDYAYRNKNSMVEWNNLENDGLYFIDLKQNKTKLIVSFQTIIQQHFKESMKGAKHKFNHIMISPEGDKVMFLHRWFSELGRRFDALIVCNIDGSNIKIISDNEMVSHCFWFDNEQIFGYLRDNKQKDSYYLIDINTRKYKNLGENIITVFGDGHPHVYQDKIVFDTYPNKARLQELYLYHYKQNKLTKLGEFFESFSFYNETRCDLHPRFSYDGTKVFFDSVHEGKRFLYMIDLIAQTTK